MKPADINKAAAKVSAYLRVGKIKEAKEWANKLRALLNGLGL